MRRGSGMDRRSFHADRRFRPRDPGL